MTLAAEELDLTQSSVSNALIRFKAVVGEDIFVRSGRKIKPTAMANYLYEQLSGPFSTIEQTIIGLQGFDKHTTARKFVILANDVIAYHLQDKLDKLTQDLPIEILIMEPPNSDQELQDALQQEQADLIIDTELPAHFSLQSQTIMNEKLVAVVAKSHPRIQGHISQEQFYFEKHVMLKLRRRNLSAADIFTYDVLAPRKVYCVKTSLLNSLATVSNSEAIGISTLRYAQAYANLFNLQILDLPFQTKAIDIKMFWKKKQTRNPGHMWLRENLLAILADV